MLLRDGGLQEIYTYYMTESEFGSPLDEQDLCVWVGDNPSEFEFDATSGLCQSAWVNGWEDITQDGLLPSRLAMLECLASAKLVKLAEHTAKKPEA